MKRLLLCMLACVAIATAAAGCAQKRTLPEGATRDDAIAMEKEAEEQWPGLYAIWKESAHGKSGITCINCHLDGVPTGADLEPNAFGGVAPETCGGCHEKEFQGYSSSRHARARDFEVNNVRYLLLNAFPAMQRQGCDACHLKVSVSCIGCHDAHTFVPPEEPDSVALACGYCHNGPDHPQLEAWELSVHGRVSAYTGRPSCDDCHTDPENVHYIVRLKGYPDEDKAAAIKIEEAGREFLIGRCAECHSREWAENQLADVDAIKADTLAIVDAARDIIRGLYADGLLKPQPGSLLDPDTGLPLLNAKGTSYSHVNPIEAKMFELFKFAEATTIKGGQHFSPDYTHWHGNQDLWQQYLEIKDMAEQIRLNAGLVSETGVEPYEYPMHRYLNETGRELDVLKK